MIVKFIKKPSAGNRGQAPGVIKYIFGATKNNSYEVKESGIVPKSKHGHTGDQEKVHFVTASKNLCIVDPMYTEQNGEIIKVDGSRADLTEIIDAFAKSEALNLRTDYPLEHIILSLTEGEELTMDDAAKMINIYMQNMGYENCTWVATYHEDTDNNHYHIALCNISNEPPHNSIQPSNKYQLSAQIRTELEVMFNLKHDKTPFIDKDVDFNRKLSKNALRNAVRNAINEVMPKSGQMPLPAFMKALNRKGVGVYAKLKNHESEVAGLSFSYRGSKIKASDLSAGFKTSDIMQHVSFDAVRDLHEVNRYNDEEQARTAIYEKNGEAIDAKADELIDAYTKGEELYVVTEATKAEIDELFQGHEAHASGSKGLLAAMRVGLESPDHEVSSELEYRAGETASTYITRAQKKAAQDEIKAIEKRKKKREAEMRKMLRDLVAAFCSCSAYEGADREEQALRANTGLEKYGIDTEATTSIITAKQLHQLYSEIWRQKKVEGKLALYRPLKTETYGQRAFLLSDKSVKIVRLQRSQQDIKQLNNDMGYSS